MSANSLQATFECTLNFGELQRKLERQSEDLRLEKLKARLFLKVLQQRQDSLPMARAS
jgi:hypothetical protein